MNAVAVLGFPRVCPGRVENDIRYERLNRQACSSSIAIGMCVCKC